MITFPLSETVTAHVPCHVTSNRWTKKLFVLYVTDLVDIVDRHGVTPHLFADDIQLYLHCLRAYVAAAATRLKMCFADIS